MRSSPSAGGARCRRRSTACAPGPTRSSEVRRSRAPTARGRAGRTATACTGAGRPARRGTARRRSCGRRHAAGGLALVVNVLDQVLRRELVEPVRRSRQALQRGRPAARWRARGRTRRARGRARPGGRACRRARTASCRARRARVHDDAVARDVLDPPGRAPSTNVSPRGSRRPSPRRARRPGSPSREVHAVEAAVGDRPAVRDSRDGRAPSRRERSRSDGPRPGAAGARRTRRRGSGPPACRAPRRTPRREQLGEARGAAHDAPSSATGHWSAAHIATSCCASTSSAPSGTRIASTRPSSIPRATTAPRAGRRGTSGRSGRGSARRRGGRRGRSAAGRARPSPATRPGSPGRPCPCRCRARARRSRRSRAAARP